MQMRCLELGTRPCCWPGLCLALTREGSRAPSQPPAPLGSPGQAGAGPAKGDVLRVVLGCGRSFSLPTRRQRARRAPAAAPRCAPSAGRQPDERDTCQRRSPAPMGDR